MKFVRKNHSKHVEPYEWIGGSPTQLHNNTHLYACTHPQNWKSAQSNSNHQLQPCSFIFLILFLLFIFPVFFFIHITKNTKTKESPPSTASNIIPKSYPLVGSFFAALANRHRFIPWMTPILQNTPSATFVLKRLNSVQVVTANPANFPAHAQNSVS